jgi:hypothetical protein
MASPLKSNGSSVPRRTTVRQRLSGQSSVDTSDSLRTFREVTDGLGNRLDLASLDGMRSGLVNNPISLMRRFLIAMRSAGLPKERALRIAVWLQTEIDARWPMEQTSLAVLQERAMRAEGEDDVRELRCLQERNAVTLRERITSLTNEIVADQLCLARFEREMEEQL